EFVDLRPRHEFIDLDRLLAFQSDRLELLVADLDVLAFLDLVGLDDILLVDLAVADAVASLGVDLVEADFLALTGRGEKLDRARDQRQTKKTLPISTRGHDKLLRRILLTAEILNVSALGPSCTVRGDHVLPPFRLFRLSG